MAGAVRIGNTVAAALTNRRVLEPVESHNRAAGGRRAAGRGAVLAIVFFPRVRVSNRAVAGWGAAALIYRGIVFYRRRPSRDPRRQFLLLPVLYSRRVGQEDHLETQDCRGQLRGLDALSRRRPGAHHSPSAIFRHGETYRRDGHPHEIDWINPHIVIAVEARAMAGGSIADVPEQSSIVVSQRRPRPCRLPRRSVGR